MYVAPFKAAMGILALTVMAFVAPRWIGGPSVAYAAGGLTLAIFVAMTVGLNMSRPRKYRSIDNR